MKTTIGCLIFLFFYFKVDGQTTGVTDAASVNFDPLKKYFKEAIFGAEKPSSLKLPIVYRDKAYSIEISPDPLLVKTTRVVIKNPFGKSYPLAYSVIYKQRLITLFEPGVFVCHLLNGLIRDTEYERAINQRRFEYQWIIGGKLVARSNGKYYNLNENNKWVIYNDEVPFLKQPKLFEDADYMAFCDCKGEFGGNAYFYNKRTKKTYTTTAICANSIFKQDNSYAILSSLGHGMGSADLKKIDSPDQLSIAARSDINKPYKKSPSSNADKALSTKTIFDLYGLQIFSTFTYLKQAVYIVNWNDRTFLATINGNVIKVVNPLFNSSLYTHDPVTTDYGDTILINMDFYGTAIEREVSCMVINDGKLVKLDWNEKQDH